MNLPFTATQFIEVFRTYNNAIWPGQIVAYALGVAALYLVMRPSKISSKIVACILAGFWAFTGIGYHLMSFSAINPAARVFGVVFTVEAGLLLFFGLRDKLRFRFTQDVRSHVGLGLMLWAMVVYPLLGVALGHGFPNGPAFGVTPCPLVIFTLGLLLLAEKLPRFVAGPAIMWSLVGSTAALSLGIREDVSLLASALVFIGLVVARLLANRRAAAGSRRVGAPIDAAA